MSEFAGITAARSHDVTSEWVIVVGVICGVTVAATIAIFVVFVRKGWPFHARKLSIQSKSRSCSFLTLNATSKTPIFNILLSAP